MQFDPASILQVDPQTILTNVITLQGNGILDNAGQVAAVDSRFTYSGSLAVWNHDGGVIAGSHAGISLDGPESEILNSAGAMVEGDDYGIYFPSGGQVHNQDAGSTIRSLSGTAISARGGVAIVENLAGASVLASGIAIDIQAGGGVLNDGAGSTIPERCRRTRTWRCCQCDQSKRRNHHEPYYRAISSARGLRDERRRLYDHKHGRRQRGVYGVGRLRYLRRIECTDGIDARWRGDAGQRRHHLRQRTAASHLA
jgi:hypothetical protein